ncbi:hypothetical protein NQ318_007824 [Aromia moschata]|uniref:Uncharacterized protein n=1 Tax=Aromia moschata TaxID=1265417 RepID=A0AAV8YZX6_9CUCU|nr:hypothetical protein NQ318_007824 [Aromia moschata]
MERSKLEDHLRRCHPYKIDKDLKYFQILKDKVQKRPGLDKMFASTSQRDEDEPATLLAGQLLAAQSKPLAVTPVNDPLDY